MLTDRLIKNASTVVDVDSYGLGEDPGSFLDHRSRYGRISKASGIRVSSQDLS